MADEAPLSTPEALKEPYTPIVGVIPGMSPSILDVMAPEGTPILLLELNAHAALGRQFLPTVKKIVDRGTPVIALADNYGSRYGTTHFVDQPQVDAHEAGVFYLENIGVGAPNAKDGNENNIVEILDVVKEGIAQGLKGQELGQFVSDQFKFPEGQKPPVPNPRESMRAKHEQWIADGLGGMTETALEALEQEEAAKNSNADSQ